MSDFEGLKNRQDLGSFIVEYLAQNPVPMSSVDGLSSAVQTGTATALPLSGTWANYGIGFAPATYRTIPGAGVYLQGLVKDASKSAAASSVIGTLPAQARPKEALIFTQWGAFSAEVFKGTVRIDVGADGKVSIVSSYENCDFLSLAGIHFWAGT